eukprot:6490567-Amphidinium_carterae.3
MSNKAVHHPQTHRYVHTAVLKSQHSHCASLDMAHLSTKPQRPVLSYIRSVVKWRETVHYMS